MLFLSACTVPPPFDGKAQKEARSACDRLRAQVFPETVNGVYEFMIGHPQFAGVDGPVGQFELVYTWQGEGEQLVKLFCRGNYVSRSVEHVEFLGKRRLASAEIDWSY
jgi:hypothetical protein